MPLQKKSRAVWPAGLEISSIPSVVHVSPARIDDSVDATAPWPSSNGPLS
jgi:hypothetical protein